MQNYLKIFLILLLCAAFQASCKSRKCIRSHEETRTMPAYYSSMCTMYDKNGMCRMQIPIYHPAYDYQIKVCDEYEKEEVEK